MTQKKKKTAKVNQEGAKASVKKKKKMDLSSKIIIVGLVIIAVPCLIFGYIVISASMQTGTPINGDRYKNDLDPAITSEQLKQVENSVQGLSNVESVTVELKTATLRVYVDASNSLDEEGMVALADEVYRKTVEVCPENTYFTQTESKKMYDLEVHVYNDLSLADSDSYIYVIQNKSSSMETSRSQVVSKAIDEDLAQQLRDDVENKNNPTPTPDPDEENLGDADIQEVEGEEEETE